MEKLDLRKLSCKHKEQLCELALKKYLAKESIAQISRDLKVHRVTVSRWVKSLIKTYLYESIKTQDYLSKKYYKKSFHTIIDESALELILSSFISPYTKPKHLWSVNNADFSLIAFYWSFFNIRKSKYKTKLILHKMFNFKQLKDFKHHFYSNYNFTGNRNLYDYCKVNNYRCYYLYSTSINFDPESITIAEINPILVVSSPRGDTGFTFSSLNDLFRLLAQFAKQRIIIIYSDKSLFSQEDMSEFSKTHSQISLVCTDDCKRRGKSVAHGGLKVQRRG